MNKTKLGSKLKLSIILVAVLTATILGGCSKDTDKENDTDAGSKTQVTETETDIEDSQEADQSVENNDVQETDEINEDEFMKRSIFIRVIESLFRLLSPLL